MTKADHLGDYLDAIARIRNLNAGTPETSFYPALANLFDAIGAGLTGRVSADRRRRDLDVYGSQGATGFSSPADGYYPHFLLDWSKVVQ